MNDNQWTLADLRAANVARQIEWCPDPDIQPDLSFRGNEMCGEVGEAIEAGYDHLLKLAQAAGRAANIIKKLERERQGWVGSRATKEALADELADVIICVDMCGMTAGIDLMPHVPAKFNEVSVRVGLKTMLAGAAQVTKREISKLLGRLDAPIGTRGSNNEDSYQVYDEDKLEAAGIIRELLKKNNQLQLKVYELQKGMD